MPIDLKISEVITSVTVFLIKTLIFIISPVKSMRKIICLSQNLHNYGLFGKSNLKPKKGQSTTIYDRKL